MNGRRFNFNNTLIGLVYVKAWWLKSIIDFARVAKNLNPGELVVKTSMLFAIPIAELTRSNEVMNATKIALDLACLILNPLGFIANKSMVAAADLKLDEWWGTLSERQRAGVVIQEVFALLHVMKFEAARKTQNYANELGMQLKAKLIKQTPQEDTQVAERDKTVSEPKPQTYRETTDYSKLDTLSEAGAKFYQHTRDKHGYVVNKPCDANQAKQHIANGGIVEVKSGHHNNIKHWYAEKNMPKVRVPTESRVTSLSVVAAKPEINPVITQTTLPEVSSSARILQQVIQPRDNNIIVINSMPINLLAEDCPVNSAVIEAEQAIPAAVEPLPTSKANTMQNVLPVVIDEPVRQQAISDEAKRLVQPADLMPPMAELSLTFHHEYAALRVTIQHYTAVAPRRQHGLFAGQLPRQLMEIQQGLNAIDQDVCTAQVGLASVKTHAAQLGNKHPIYLAVLKCEGALSNAPVRSVQRHCKTINL